ncbi:chromosome segregation ATPase [Oxalobacteraceae bacterium GrIS 1.18]
MKERLAENEQHRQSLEEKHQHARDALEHYRASIKEQRDQDQRRHEQQIQQLQAEMRHLQQSLIVKQDEVTRLNQEGVRLIAELSHAQKNLHDQQMQCRQIEQKLHVLKNVEQHASVLEARLVDKERQNSALTEQLNAAVASESVLKIQVRNLELEVAAATAKADGQQGIVAELRAYLDLNRKTG